MRNSTESSLECLSFSPSFDPFSTRRSFAVPRLGIAASQFRLEEGFISLAISPETGGDLYRH
jgi:hypothetical protein